MSKPVKDLISKSYTNRFGDIEGAVVIDLRGIKSIENTALRNGLAQKAIKVTVVKNSLARNLFADTAMAPIGELLQGPSALVYGAESVVEVARELIAQVKEVEFEFKGAIMDGQLFGANEVEALSKYPTRDEAIGQVVQVILGPASQIAGALTGPAGSIAACLDTIKEKLEKGETIEKIA